MGRKHCSFQTKNIIFHNLKEWGRVPPVLRSENEIKVNIDVILLPSDINADIGAKTR